MPASALSAVQLSRELEPGAATISSCVKASSIFFTAAVCQANSTELLLTRRPIQLNCRTSPRRPWIPRS